MKRTVPLMIAIVAGFVVILSTFVPYTEEWGEKGMIWFDILAVGAFVLGGGNLLKLHLEKISGQRAGWMYSVIIIVSFVVTLVIGLLQVGVHPNPKYPDFAWGGNYLEEGAGFWWIYQYVIYPLTSTMFAMLAFYVASAAFRAFRAKNFEATLLLLTAFIVLLGRTYAGVWLTGWVPGTMVDICSWFNIASTVDDWRTMRLDRLTEWLALDGPTKGAGRAIIIGIALGVVSVSLKILLGVDRSYLGQD